MDTLSAMETSYVVQMFNYYRMSPRIKPCFKFVHRAPMKDGSGAAGGGGGAGGAGEERDQTEGEWSVHENPAIVEAEAMRRQAAAAASSASTSISSAASSSESHSRHTSLTFPIPLAGTVHGFAGYFTSHLYGGIELSIVPGARFSKGMFSWFPLFFPLKTPITLASGATLGVDMWRCTNARKVWYEWALTAPITSPIHNPNGRSSAIGL
jgi:hypothetical protein